jgi:gliding motility-associated-like protein
VVLKISNTAPPGCGNAFAIDDITLRACGPKVSAGIGAEALVDVNVCDGDKTTFVLSGNYSSGFTNPAFQWQFLGDNLQWQNIPGANARSFVRPVTTSGVYSYRMLIGESAGFSALPCRIASNVVVINVLPPPFVQATNYIYGCLGGDVSMLASGGVKFLWTGPNGYTSTSQMAVLPKVQYSDSGLYKVEATTDFGCKNADSTILKVYPNATAKASGSSFICYGASRVLEAGGGVKYRWEPAKGLSADTIASPVASPVENTLYKVTVTNQYGCTDTASVRINVWEKPEANAGPDLKTRIGLPVVLRGSAKGANVSWHWIEANGTASTQQLTPMFNPRQTTTYRFNVVSGNGCGISTDEMTVKVYEKVLIPNAFSPNGDGINDTWNIEPLYFFPESVTGVYNRYGQPVYRSRGYNTQWNGTSNGKPLPAGTYYYVIDLKVNKEPALTGSVTILR